MTEKFICDGIGSRELVQNHIENTDLWRSVLWWQSVKIFRIWKTCFDCLLYAYYVPNTALGSYTYISGKSDIEGVKNLKKMLPFLSVEKTDILKPWYKLYFNKCYNKGKRIKRI